MIIGAWVLWLLFVIVLIGLDLLGVKFGGVRQNILILGLAVGSYSLICAILMFSQRCDNCNELLLGEKFVKHEKFQPRKYLGGWATVVVDVVFTNKFTCMHCGTTFRVD